MKYVLIDDERLAVEHLKVLLLKTGKIKEEHLVTFTNPMDAIHYIEKEKPQVVFADIEMPMVSGITLASRVRSSCPGIEVIFVTAHKQYAVEAFEQYALDYLLKPLMLERVKKTVERIEERLKEKSVVSPLDSPKILIKLMGDAGTFKEGMMLDYKWRSGKIRELFVFLLHNRHRFVSKYEIFETLIPEEDPDKSAATLNMILYRLRNKLQQHDLPIVIKFQDDAYKLVYPDEVQVDVDLWEQHLKTTPIITEKNLSTCLNYIALAEGPYLKNLDYPWLADQHEIYQEKFLERLRKIGDFYFNHRYYEDALEIYRKIYHVEPLNEWLNVRLLELLRLLRNNRAKNKLYEDIQKKYLEYDVPLPTAIISAFNEESRT
ncbi:response regulator [Proteiniclasticum ruminis]|uniref:Stage 0 sporulation protein A homolog n=1 Tax=Proteiniclasticum ruminis TaxID=398199 RepID=A0A1G8P9X9_9CLOT|nr:response regulator [Proteiniclasticum ruminis]SDI89108.1 Two-component response regulator, SAPR family, consists of REC, wHTH and BTAD domains [Proteiniclasticum ruminis]